MVEVTLQVSLEGCVGALQVEGRVEARRVLPSRSQKTVHRRQFPGWAAQLGGKQGGGSGAEAGGKGPNCQGFPTDRAPSHPTHQEGVAY